MEQLKNIVQKLNFNTGFISKNKENLNQKRFSIEKKIQNMKEIKPKREKMKVKNQCEEKWKNLTKIKEEDIMMKDMNENNIQMNSPIIQTNWEQLLKEKENFTQSEFLKKLDYNIGNIGTLGNTYNNTTTTNNYYQGCDINQVMNQVMLYVQNIISLIGKEYDGKMVTLMNYIVNGLKIDGQNIENLNKNCYNFYNDVHNFKQKLIEELQTNKKDMIIMRDFISELNNIMNTTNEDIEKNKEQRENEKLEIYSEISKLYDVINNEEVNEKLNFLYNGLKNCGNGINE